MINFNEEENSAFEDLLSFQNKIIALGLEQNITEFTDAIHKLQMILIMHMLHRLDPIWSDWYRK